MGETEAAVTRAMDAIDGFLRSTAEAPAEVDAETLQRLARRIERARDARLESTPTVDAALRELRERYRSRLLLLQKRLSETQDHLVREQRRIADERDRLAVVREWHNVFTTTH